ncbi:hypothetical protein IL54_1814 [Sphingobium sp. ba1]|uniref:hypothetical protein n=1 Tax=Sphingobium sp. ba1 TaxID=1522072 RepID=UPI000507B53C|nr:hypothetical protein [Sphingobium sp. ba1]KFL46398.1 hypothetical protein IL54_1814 [Sphingobium sp. ba1]
MARRNITDLPDPKERCRPDRAPPYGKKKQKFPTLAEARAENLKRAKLIRKACRNPTNLFNRDDALALADLLEKAAQGQESESLACKVYMGRMRIKIGGALWKLADEE